MPQQSLRQAAQQKQALTARQQHAVRLLQLSSQDYEHELKQMATTNPFLELDQDRQDADAADAEVALVPPVQAGAIAPRLDQSDGDTESTFESDPGADMECHVVERDRWLPTPSAFHESGQNRSDNALDWVAAIDDLRQRLHRQANLLRLTARDRALVSALIESLDDDGYLRLDLKEFEGVSGVVPPPDGSEVGTALKLVQSFAPAGVGARTVSECLLLQLESVEPALRDVCSTIAHQHLDRWASGDLKGIGKLLGLPVAEVEIACQALRRLDPRPGWRYSRSEAQFVTPDVIVRKVRGAWEVRNNAAVMPAIRLNRSCAELFEQHREPVHGEMNAQLNEARWAVRNAQLRFSTILLVARAILRRQHLFFEHGQLAMKPLSLGDIAEDVGVHESTVCRVTNNKYMATPSGVFELKKFFSRALPMKNGGACSATAIKGVVKELIESEDRRKPFTDGDIALRLGRQGLTVGRRTVTNYRKVMQIPPAGLRGMA